MVAVLAMTTTTTTIIGQVVRTRDNMTLNPDNMAGFNYRADLVKILAN